MEFCDLKRQYQKYKTEIDQQIQEVLDSTQFIMSPKIRELEEKLASFTGAKYAIGVSSGTDALLFALMALGIKPGDEVITTPFTFIATAEVISLVGAVPVFADIDPVYYNINPLEIEKKITPRTKAIIGVSLYGQCADFKAINRTGEKHGIPVIEDACQSFGAETPYGKSCNISEISTTSFFPSKPLGSYGDGGMIFTNDEDLANKMSKIRVHGQAERYQHAMLGTNGRLDALQAAVLLAKWPHFDEEIRLRQKAGEYYTQGLSAVPGILTPKVLPGYTHVYAQFSIQVNDRNALAHALKAEGIPTAVHYPVPLHLQPVYKGLGFGEGSFPVSEAVAGKIISLPMHSLISKEEQDKVIAAVKKALGA